MQSLKAFSITSAVNNWLANSYHPRLLHVFDHACNLINKHREILSIVTPQIGNGPFNLVIRDDILFSEHLKIESPVFVADNQLRIGGLSINTADAILWNPCPDWASLHRQRDEISNGLAILPRNISPIAYEQFSILLFSALSIADTASAQAAAQKLAGLGIGLTPSGDDFLMGAMHAAWIIHPGNTALPLTRAIAETAAPLTTSLSAAWIKSAGRGEAGELWHDFFDALTDGNEINIQASYEKILSVGETSGADALTGFVGTVECWMKRNVNQHTLK